ncbi:Detected protein of unknown function [Hibiscus syriacus]|uniref:Uncharacterized protein n=1 Tax=Hibiscus syriacus TaxID=106335 RepID=A0A6A2YD06_HIBSY|nr:Detected protein of unknown function [Hibiscus syriacus]
MAPGMKTIASTVALFGVISLIFGVVAENKKPPHGNPEILIGRDKLICKYPSDRTVALGFLSIASLGVSVLVGHYAVFYPYNGRSIPPHVFFRSISFMVFFLITLFSIILNLRDCGCYERYCDLRGHYSDTITAVASNLDSDEIAVANRFLKPYLTKNVHKDLKSTCPTAKTGLFGGAAFMALNASLFWLICLMLVDDVRKDYLAEQDDSKAQLFITNKHNRD